MTCQLSLDKLREIIGAIPFQLPDLAKGKRAIGVNTDTRTLRKGEVFVALEGENFNGHDFLENAIAKGAIALIINRNYSVNLSRNIPQFRVEDTLKAYQKIGRWWRDQHAIPIVGITGSVGKTSTKELIASVLSTKGKVLKTQANYNNEIGVPKTLLALESDHDYAVVEMAMRGLGEIALLTEIARPTVGVITNVGTAHIGRLGSEEAIATAKCELLATMPSDSVAVLNHDCPRLLQTAAGVWQGETLTYGLEGGNVHGELLDSQTLKVEGKVFPLPLPGRHQALNYLAALTVAKVLGIDWSPLTEGISVQLPSGRSQRHLLPNDILILDETYNAG
ncbi:MAG: UDP-N-acetylmuramoyl-tripeptide--D-alanyl-D-alanine ligase, partial [Chroococcales cyanobacterium]